MLRVEGPLGQGRCMIGIGWVERVGSMSDLHYVPEIAIRQLSESVWNNSGLLSLFI